MAEDDENRVSGNLGIIPINIEDEMRGAYIDYSMSVIISRALPDVRDGLKPVHRRILFSMLGLGLTHNRPFRKSATVVGDVLAKYHPHGDAAVYDSMVRMAQGWSMRYKLVEGQGNFGSVDGDPPAAMRYTEARLTRLSEEMLADIKKKTVDFQQNFDDSIDEPVVLPSKLPNLLLNGISGIAVGMATNMAPHNLTELVDGIIAFIDNRDITLSELMEHIKAPDFPTGAIIYGTQGVKSAYETGRGRIVMRARADVEETKTGKQQIVVTEIPYQVNKALMIEKTAALVNEKKLEGITAIRDESDRKGYRVVYELRKDAIANVVLNNLYKHTQLQSSFSVNNVALVNGRPKTLNLTELIHHYVEHRHEVVIRRTEFELDEAEKRAHILEGYIIALDNIDEIIELIKGSANADIAREGLIKRFNLSEIQARAILDMRLQRLTGLEREKIETEYKEVKETIERLKGILESEDIRMQIIKDELLDVKEKFGDERRTEVIIGGEDFTDEDMIPNEDFVVTFSKMGYVKRTLLNEYRTQTRGGVGARGVITKDDDYTEALFVSKAHNYLLIFTEKGRLFWLKTYQVPEGSKASKGRPIQNLISIEPDDSVKAVITVTSLSDEDYINNNFLVMCTKKGLIKKTSLEAYSRPRQNGINAITINEEDELLNVSLTNGNNHIIVASKSGRAVHFHEEGVRPMGRMAAGVKGITLNTSNSDEVVGMVCVDREEANLLVVTETGFGKRTRVGEYRITKRGGKGVKALNITEKTGALVGIKQVIDEDQLMIINKSGIVIRLSVEQLRVMGRATQGVKLIKLGENDSISSIEKIDASFLTEEEEIEGVDLGNEDKTEENNN